MIFTLIGMPGCGKSCMGRAISGKLKMKLVDTDKLIEKRYNKKLFELIDEVGIDEFRRIEEEVLLSVDGDDLIVSTGGSAIYSDKAMNYFKERGKLIYLFCSFPLIEKRLGDYSKRGIVLPEGRSLKDLYDERTQLYSRYADITVICDGNAFPKYQSAVIAAVNKAKAENR